MTINNYYFALQPALKDHILLECKARRIPYRKLWNEHQGTFFRGKIENCAHKYVVDINNYLFLFDLCLVWVSCYSQLLSISFFQNDKHEENSQHNVMNLISWRILSDLAAVRCLVLEGFDVQAKQVSRSVSENVDALGIAALDQQFASQFIVNQDIDLNKTVWFNHIAKGKARRKIESALEKFTNVDFSENRIFRNQEEAVLSAAAHPSFISGFVTLFPDFDEGRDSELVGISKFISGNSVRTLKYCCYRIAEHSLYDLAVYKSYERFLDKTPDDWNKRTMRELKNVVKVGRELSMIVLSYISDGGALYTLRSKR